MAKFCPLFSSSSGNSAFIGGNSGGVLVDIGVSAKKITDALKENGIEPDEIKGIFITHEHNDHIKGLSVFLKKYNIPVFASRDTLSAIEKCCELPSDAKLKEIDGVAELYDMQILRFPTSHDCVGSSGYKFMLENGPEISVCTDLGIVTDEVRNAIKGSDLIMLESNHDLQMLKKGPYPPLLKLRILGDTGHLSNNSCATELPFFLNNGTQRFVLGHLSKENNLPTIAYSTAVTSLADIGAEVESDYILRVAPEEKGEMLYL